MTNIEVLTVEEIAALLKIEPRTVYRKVEANEIPGAFRVGQNGAIRFVKEEILKWITEQVQKGQSSESTQPQ